jgi:hypothetical protein
MSSLAGRLMLCVGLGALGVVVAAGSAAAKGLPVESVSVSTAQPQTGQPIDLVVRFERGFDLGDEFAWASGEIAVYPAARTDRNGWRLDRNDRGLPIQLHRVSRSVFGGSFTVTDPGEYVLVSRSASISHDDRLRLGPHACRGCVWRENVAPVRLHVADGATTQTGSSGTPMLAIGVTAVSVTVIVAAAFLCLARRRGLRQRPEEPAVTPVEDRVLVGDGPKRP